MAWNAYFTLNYLNFRDDVIMHKNILKIYVERCFFLIYEPKKNERGSKNKNSMLRFCSRKNLF